MGAVADAVVDLAEAVVDAVTIFVKAVWDEVAMPILEEVFSWFGIEDETVVETQKVSALLYSTTTTGDPYSEAITRAALKFSQTESSFFVNYMDQVFARKVQVKSFFRYAKSLKYTHGLPDLTIQGGNIDTAAIDTALETDLGFAATVLNVNTTFPTPEQYFHNWLQAAPYNYLPYVGTLTFTDPYGVARSDYVIDSIVFNAGPGDYTIQVSRVAQEAQFWIEGIESVTEGETAIFTVFSNATVPTGESVDINFIYSGTAVNGTDYTQIVSVTMLANTSQVDVPIVTLESATAGSDFTITINSITNTNAAFEAVTIHANNSITTTIIDNDTLVLTMSDQLVGEGDGIVTIPVTLTQDAPLYISTTDIFDNGIDYVDTDNQLILSATPEDDAYVNVEFDTVQVTNWTRVDNTLTFTGDFTGVTQIIVEISTRQFTVDFTTTNITAVNGVDYDTLGGTLNFIGNAAESQDIVITINPDAANDDNEQFSVGLTNCSEPTIDITRTSVVTITDGTSDPVPQTITLVDTITRPNFLDERTMIVIYHADTDPANEWFIWHYLLDSNIYPINPTSSQISGLDMLPVAILRRDKISITSDRQSQEYITTKKLMQKLGLDIEEIVTNIESNADINLIDDAYINFSICPNSVHPLVSKMLWMNFYEIIVTYGIVSNTSQYTAKFEEQDINNAVVWTYHEHLVDQAGTVTTVGQYIHSQVAASDADGDFTILRIQYQKSVGLYDELNIHRLNGMTGIKYAGHHEIAVHKIGSDHFTIPVSWFVLDQFSHKEVLQLYPYMFRLDITAINIIHLEWYETAAFLDLFSLIIKIVALVYILYTSDLSGAEALLSIASAYITGQLTLEIIKKILEANPDSDVAKALAIVFAVYVGVQFGDGDSWVDDLLLGMSATGNVIEVYTEVKMDVMEQDWANFHTDYMRQQEDLEEAFNDLTRNQSMIDYIQHTIINKIESPEVFYNRTLNLAPTTQFLDLAAQLNLDIAFEKPIQMITVREN